MALPRSIHGGDWGEAITYPVRASEAPEAFGSRGFSASENPLGSAISSDEATPPEAGGEGPGVMTLRQIAEKAGLCPTVLVADIERTEAVWCEMAPGLPESIKTVIIEIHPQLIGAAPAGATVQALLDEGFRVAGISGLVFAMCRS